MDNARYTSLVPNPPATPSGPAQRTVTPEARTQWDAERAHNKLLKHDAETAIKVYAVIDSMMADLDLSKGERLRMRAELSRFFFNEVTMFSLNVSYGMIQS